MERGFMDVKTCKDIINSRAGKQKLITIEPGHEKMASGNGGFAIMALDHS